MENLGCSAKLNTENPQKRDVILQTVSQAFAHRLVHYASSATLFAFPRENGFCDSAEELGYAESEYNGPCLVLLRNCRLTAQELVQHILSTFLRGYIMRIYWCHYSGSSKSQMILHIRSLVELLRDTGKTSVCTCRFVNDDKIHEKEHGRPQNSIDDFGNTELKFRLQTHPRGLAELLLDELPELECSLHDFTYSIYVVEIDGTFHYGIDVGSNMYLLGSNRDALSKGCVSKASTKIEEALHVFNLKLREGMLVLDVGAAPGAWTEYLSRYANSVLAIDPGKLCLEAQRSNVSHICKKIFQGITAKRIQYNKGSNCLGGNVIMASAIIFCETNNQPPVEDAHRELQAWTRTRSFDLLVCDINKHPVEAAEIIAALLPYLMSGGSLILTLKFYGRGKFKESKINEIFDIFHGSLVEMECVWLMANSIYERTLFGKRA